jgi:hypothetical protein
MTDTSKQYYATTQDTENFVVNLVKSMTNSDISQLPIDEQETITNYCVNGFVEYVVDYVSIKYSQADGMRLKFALKLNKNPFDNFRDLKDKFNDAYRSFLTELESIS